MRKMRKKDKEADDLNNQQQWHHPSAATNYFNH